jgi:VWFA-related protein
MKTLVTLLLAGVLISAQSPQTPQAPPVFRTGATLVPLDVRVIDRDGKPITDLRQDEFIVYEDGVRQEIKHFSSGGVATGPAPSGTPVKLRAAAPAATLTHQTSRIFLLVLGRGRLQPPSKGVDAMIQFVRDRLLPQDQVAIFAWNRATDFTVDHKGLVTLLEKFKTQHEEIERDVAEYFTGLRGLYGDKSIPAFIQTKIDSVFAVAGVGPAHALVIDPNARTPVSANSIARSEALLRAEVVASRDKKDYLPDPMTPADQYNIGGSLDEYLRDTASTANDVANVYAGIEYLRHIDGEKHLVLVTEQGFALPRFDDEIAIARAATDARVAVDTIQTGGASSAGLVSAVDNRPTTADGARAPKPMPSMVQDLEAAFKIQSLRSLSEITGGQASAFSYAEKAMKRIDEATRFGYLLGYYSAKTAQDGSYRKVEVKITRKGAEALYRRGYSARPALATTNRREMITYVRMARAASTGIEIRDIPTKFAARSVQGEAERSLEVDINVPVDRLTLDPVTGGRRTSLDLAVFVSNRDGKLVGQVSKRVEVTLTDEVLARARISGLTANVSVPIGKAIATRVKVIVYDFGKDLLGSTVWDIR